MLDQEAMKLVSACVLPQQPGQAPVEPALPVSSQARMARHLEDRTTFFEQQSARRLEDQTTFFEQQEECFPATCHLEQQAARPRPATHRSESLVAPSWEEDF